MLENLSSYLESAPILAVIAAYLGGVLTSFTPCVFPVLPITVGVLGVSQSSSKLRAFFKSIVYVLGMSIVYAGLGMAAALTGKMFGSFSVNPITNIVVANICILFGLNMLDVFYLPLPSFLTSRKMTGQKQMSLIGVFFMGMTSGTVVAPCTAPVLGTLLTFVGSSGNVVFGSLLLFVFAFGLGTLMVLIGVFGGLVSAIQSKSSIMGIIKKILGFLMIVIGEYFLVKAGTFMY